MFSAQLPENSETQNEQQEIRKLKQQNGTFLHFRRLYLLNSPPGEAIDQLIKVGEPVQKLTMKKDYCLHYFHVLAVCEIDEREGIMSSRYSL